MNGYVNFNSIQIKSIQQKMYELSLNIIEDLEQVSKIIDNSNSYFDTPTGAHFRDVSKNVISMGINYIQQDVYNIIKGLDTIISVYNDYSIATGIAVNGGKNEI